MKRHFTLSVLLVAPILGCSDARYVGEEYSNKSAEPLATTAPAGVVPRSEAARAAVPSTVTAGMMGTMGTAFQAPAGTPALAQDHLRR